MCRTEKIRFIKFLCGLQWLLLFSLAVKAQTNPSAQSLPYSQNFSGLASSSTTYPAGWQGWTIGTASSTSFRLTAPTANVSLTASSTAATTGGGVHNYNGKIGFLATGSTDPAICLSINTTNEYNVAVQFDAMTIRNPYNGSTNTRINQLSLQYRVGTSGNFSQASGAIYSNNTTAQTSGTTPQNSLTYYITLPSACENQSEVQLRWVQRDYSGNGSRPSFAVDNISIDGTSAGDPNMTKYYRTKASGDWADASTWEISNDGISGWSNATYAPTYASSGITIESGHTIIYSSAFTMDQMAVETGAVFEFQGGVFTLNDGTGIDLIIEGTFLQTTTSSADRPQGTGTIIVRANAIVEIRANPSESDRWANNEDASLASRITWENSSVFYWNTSALFSSSNITYFPNAGTSDVPIFRINCNCVVGANNPTVINGVLEVLSGKNLQFQNTGVKTFRNGIMGNGTITQSTTGPSGRFDISGTAQLGIATLTLSANGMLITSASKTSMSANVTANSTSGAGTITVSGILDAASHVLSGTGLFTLTSGGTLVTAHTNGVNGSVTVSGTKTFNAAANYKFNNNSAAQVTGTLMGAVLNNLTIENGSATGVTLSQATTINGTLTLTDGELITTSANLPNISASSSVASASDNSYVKGPIKKTGTSDFAFPVGKNGNYQPITISSISGIATNAFTAEYFTANPQVVYGTTKDGTINNISTVEYWVLDQSFGSPTAVVELAFDANSGGVTSLPDLVVARWNGSAWKDHTGACASCYSGTVSTGTAYSNGAVTSFSPFALASKTSANPLPVELLEFNAKCDNDKIALGWSTLSEINNDYFTLEKSFDGIAFNPIAEIKGAGNSAHLLNYEFYDNSPVSPKDVFIYYRLKQTDFDGRYEYSDIVTAKCEKKKEPFVFPTVSNNGQITIKQSSYPATVEIYNVTGEIIFHQVLPGNQKTLDLAQLSSGIYFVKINSEIVHRILISR